MKTNEYESIDRDMSSWLVSTMHNGTRFYISDNEVGNATDILANAKRFRWSDQADMAAEWAMADLPMWSWKAVRVAECMAAVKGVGK